MSRVLIAASRVITPQHTLVPGWVDVQGDRLTAVGSDAPPREPDLELPDGTLIPGLVDVHVHGGGGASFQEGQDAAQQVLATHRRHGTTTMVASLVTDSLDRLERSVRSLAPLVTRGLLAGIHLEGPWLSPRMAGAHDPSLLRPPDYASVRRLLAAGAGTVRMVTIAPELDGALDAVRQLVAARVVVAVGHTDATYDETRAVLDAGARVGTHLHNAMRRPHHREPGPAHALLERADAYVEAIADGVHLHPAMLRAAARQPASLVLITDAMAAAAAPDGDYELGGQAVHVREGVARLRDAGAIAGSTLTLAAALRHAVSAGLSLQEAVAAATSASAAMLGRTDIGRLAPGGRSDLVVLNRRHEVCQVMKDGCWLGTPVQAT